MLIASLNAIFLGIVEIWALILVPVQMCQEGLLTRLGGGGLVTDPAGLAIVLGDDAEFVSEFHHTCCDKLVVRTDSIDFCILLS